MSNSTNDTTTEQTITSTVDSFTTGGGATSESTSAAEMDATTTAEEVARDPEAGAILWGGVKPEYIIIPVILLGIPMFVLIYCMIKAAISRDPDAEDELLKKAKDSSDKKDSSRRKKDRYPEDNKKAKGKKAERRDRKSVSPTDLE